MVLDHATSKRKYDHKFHFSVKRFLSRHVGKPSNPQALRLVKDFRLIS